MRTTPRFVKSSDYFNYTGIDLMEDLQINANESNKADIFLMQIEDFLIARIEATTFRKGNWNELDEYQLEYLRKAIIVQAQYIINNSNLFLDSGYDPEKGEIISKAKIDSIAICSVAVDFLKIAGLYNNVVFNRHRYMGGSNRSLGCLNITESSYSQPTSGFTPTQAQLAAMNSGITANKVNSYNNYSTSKQDAITSQSKLSSDLVDTIGHTNQFVTSGDKTTWNEHGLYKHLVTIKYNNSVLANHVYVKFILSHNNSTGDLTLDEFQYSGCGIFSTSNESFEVYNAEGIVMFFIKDNVIASHLYLGFNHYFSIDNEIELIDDEIIE